MRDRKRWKGLVALAMSAAMLFSQTVAYAQEGQPVEQAETVGQTESVEQTKSVQYFDLYAQTEDGEPIDGISIYAGEGNTQSVFDVGNICMHIEIPIFDKSSGEIRWYGADRTYDWIANKTKDGYAKLLYNEEEEGEVWQFTPANYEGEGFLETKDIITVIKVKDWEGNLIGDITLEDTTKPCVNYKVENLKEGWDITLSKSEITSFYENPVTGENVIGFSRNWNGEPEILLSITAIRKSDARLAPVSYEFGGTQDLVFKFDNTLADDIKEVKEVLFAVQDNVQPAESDWLNYFLIDNYGASYTYDLEKGEVVLKKDALSELIYGAHPSIGNTYIGQMTYIAKDGTEKTVNGDWYIKVLEKGSVTTKPISDCQITLGSTSVTYNGAAQTPAITVKDGSRTLTSGTDYTVAYKDNTSVGTAQVTVTGKGSYTGTVTKEFTITNADIAGCTVSLNADSYVYNGTAKTPSVTVKDGTDTLKSGTDYTVTYADNTNAGTARVTVTGRGNYTGTVTKNFTIQKADQKFNYTKSYSKAYGSKAFALNAKLKAGNGKLTYATSNKKVATVKNGKVTVTGTGAATITVKAARTANYNAASVTVTIKASPAKQTLKSLKAVKGRKLTVTWKKDTRATGYQIQYSTDKNFKKGVKTATVSKYKTVSKTITKLTKGKRYYVRVRSYKSAKVSGKTQKLYGAWSGAKRSGSIKK